MVNLKELLLAPNQIYSYFNLILTLLTVRKGHFLWRPVTRMSCWSLAASPIRSWVLLMSCRAWTDLFCRAMPRAWSAKEKDLGLGSRACLQFAALIARAALETGPHAASGQRQLLIELTCVNGCFDQLQGGDQLRGWCNLNCKLASGQFKHPGSEADGHITKWRVNTVWISQVCKTQW